MGYKWSEQADGEGSSAKLLPGIHKVTGVKTVHGEGPKGPWLMLVVENEEHSEGTVVFTLTEKAGWTLARWIARCNPDDLKSMEEGSIEPKHFVNDTIAQQYLVGAECWVEVTPGKNPKYLNIEPIKEEEVPSKGGKAPPKKPKEPQPSEGCPEHGDFKNCPDTCQAIPF